MSKVNEYEASPFGYARFGGAVFDVVFNSQNIPSELYDNYRMNVGFARDFGFIAKRYPWRISQPGTPSQKIQWGKFRDAVDWFNLLTPDERHDVYVASQESGLFYYTWFIKQVLLL